MASSPFRTTAWTSAWLETYGKLPGVEVYDLGGSGRPTEMVYTASYRVKGLLPVRVLSLVGCGNRAMASPRSEFNDFQLNGSSVGINEIIQKSKNLRWQVASFSDFAGASKPTQPEALLGSSGNNHCLFKVTTEPTYRISGESFAGYAAALGKNTRSRYVNKRSRLADLGEVAWELCPAEQSSVFFQELNGFHQSRWGQPCYSSVSLAMMNAFIPHFISDGGSVYLSRLRVNGDVVSVLYDLEWQGVRYNLQSGYAESLHSQLKLGSIHLGKAIEEALDSGCQYECLAGEGKNDAYKKRLATSTPILASVEVRRGALAHLTKLAACFGGRHQSEIVTRQKVAEIE